MRQLFTFTLFAACLLTTWYNYAPLEQRQALPAPLRTAIVYTDAAFSRGLTMTSEYFSDYLTERANNAGAVQSQGPYAEQSDNGAAWIANAEDGIVRIYEKPPTDQSASLPTAETMFLGATLTGANLSQAALAGALLDGADARGASFADADLKNASARLASFKSAIFHRADLTSASMQRAEFDRAIFVDSQLREGQFVNASMTRIHVRGGSAISARFENASLAGAVIEEADFRRASFRAADLTGAVFSQVQLHGAQFDGAQLSRADLRQTSGLTRLALSGACGDATTRLPEGLSISPCDGPRPGLPLAQGPDIAHIAAYANENR